MKKEYESPEFSYHKLSLYDVICLSNPEGQAGGGGWGDDEEETDATTGFE